MACGSSFFALRRRALRSSMVGEPLGFEDVESLAERGGFLLALATSRSFYRRMIAGA